MWPISEESTALVRRLLSIGDVPMDNPESGELKRLLGEANEKRKKLIDLSQSGKAPHMFDCGFLEWTMRGASADEAAPEDFKRSVQTVLDACSETNGENVLPSSPKDDTITPVTKI